MKTKKEKKGSSNNLDWYFDQIQLEPAIKAIPSPFGSGRLNLGQLSQRSATQRSTTQRSATQRSATQGKQLD